MKERKKERKKERIFIGEKEWVQIKDREKGSGDWKEGYSGLWLEGEK